MYVCMYVWLCVCVCVCGGAQEAGGSVRQQGRKAEQCSCLSHTNHHSQRYRHSHLAHASRACSPASCKHVRQRRQRQEGGEARGRRGKRDERQEGGEARGRRGKRGRGKRLLGCFLESTCLSHLHACASPHCYASSGAASKERQDACNEASFHASNTQESLEARGGEARGGEARGGEAGGRLEQASGIRGVERRSCASAPASELCQCSSHAMYLLSCLCNSPASVPTLWPHLCCLTK